MRLLPGAAALLLSTAAFHAIAEVPAADTAAAAAPIDQVEAEAAPRQPLERSFIVGVVGEPRSAPLQGTELERRTHEVGLLLRCPVCQGSAVADSPSPTAINMKNEVRDLLAQGFDQAQILAWFEASYGQFVLMQPKAEGLNLVVWLGPGFVLLAGLAFVLLQLRRLRGRDEHDAAAEELDEEPAAAVSPLGAADSDVGDPELTAYVREVRELAYGWTHGEPPPSSRKDS